MDKVTKKSNKSKGPRISVGSDISLLVDSKKVEFLGFVQSKTETDKCGYVMYRYLDAFSGNVKFDKIKLDKLPEKHSVRELNHCLEKYNLYLTNVSSFTKSGSYQEGGDRYPYKFHEITGDLWREKN